jgi:hypothetical protein
MEQTTGRPSEDRIILNWMIEEWSVDWTGFRSGFLWKEN